MDCPECHQPMSSKRAGEVIIDECAQCKGIWFDHHELDEVKDRLYPDIRWMKCEPWERGGVFHVGKNRTLKCPRCEDIHLYVFYREESDVTLQLCPQCKGMWLGAVDFNNIILAMLLEAERKTLLDYAKASLKQASETIANPGRLLSEWKDLEAVLRLLKYRFFADNPMVEDILAGLRKSMPL